MKGHLTQIPLLDQPGEVIVSKGENRISIHRAHRSGRLRKLAPRVYTSNLVDPPEKVVKSNCWMLAGALFPNALIADRTALEQRPAADGSVFLVSQGGASEIELPGIIFRARGGPPAIPGYDVPFLAGLWMSSQARALLDNLKPSRQRTKVRRTLTK